jgi:CRISPR type IV-associated protein Csf1
MTGSEFAFKQLNIKLMGNQVKDDYCCLCGSELNKEGFNIDKLKSSLLESISNLKNSNSRSLCKYCYCFIYKESFDEYIKGYKIKEIKNNNTVSWRSFSHIFYEGYHEFLNHETMRYYLLNLPNHPFMISLSTSGQKHIIYQSKIAYSKDYFPIQLEDNPLWIKYSLFLDCLFHFETLYNLGFSKQDILTGELNINQLLKSKFNEVKIINEELNKYRNKYNDIITLCNFIAQKEKEH